MKTNLAVIGAAILISQLGPNVSLAQTTGTPGTRGDLTKLMREIPRLSIELNGQKGKFASVFFASGRESPIGLSGRTLKARSIFPFKVPGRPDLQTHYVIPISDQDRIEVPATTVMRQGVDLASHLIILVHPTSRTDLFVCNPDTKSTPKDPRLKGQPCTNLPESQYKVDESYFFTLDDLSRLNPQPDGTYFLGTEQLIK